MKFAATGVFGTIVVTTTFTVRFSALHARLTFSAARRVDSSSHNKADPATGV